tara:strand:+ start:878 stop:1564 length:687 start_codon:yes stop_codon:yes gene_type:complete
MTAFLKNLKTIQKEVDIFVPSLQADIKFKPLTLKHQKSILDNVELNAISIVVFYNKLNDIIQELGNQDFNIIDRPNIILSLREKINKKYGKFNLSKLITSNRELKLINLVKTVETNDFIFELASPSFKVDSESNNYLIKNFKTENKLLGKLYISELTKFTKSVTIKSDNEKVEFSDLTVEEKFDIIENIPSSSIAEVYNYIKEVREFETQFITQNDDIVEINPELFIL